MGPPSRAADRGAPPASARGLALDILGRVETTDAWADRLLAARLRHTALAPRDRALLTELVLGTLRWQRWLDWHVERAARRPVHALVGWLRALLRLSAYQLARLDRIPPWAAVNEAVELAKRRGPPGVAGFVNGVLRTLAGGPRPWADPTAVDPIEALALRTSQPTWLVRRWCARLGLAEAEALARAMSEAAPLVVRVNRLRASVEEVVTALSQHGTRATPTRWALDGLVLETSGDPWELPPLRDGLATVQDEAAILVGLALDPRPGELVADICAAPGTKTTHLAALMANRGRILAADAHPGRLGLLRTACARLGATIVEPQLAEASALASVVGATCDRVLVDAPCSNLGVLRRNPDGKWRRTADDLADLAGTQVAILDAAAALLRPGGILVYATCSLEPEENAAVVAAVRARRPELVPDPLPATIPPECREAPEVLQMAPHRHDSDGFTAHRLRRRA